MRGHQLRARRRGRAETTVGILLASSVIWATWTAGAGPAGAVQHVDRGVVVHPLIDHVGRVRHSSAPPTTAQCLAKTGIRCYGPSQLEIAYDEQPLFHRHITGTGQTIVTVESYGAPHIRRDLAHFDRAYGLETPPKVTILKYGKLPPFDPSTAMMTSWAVETALDVEYAHTAAPGADILVVETPTSAMVGASGFSTIVNAENYVIDHHLGDVITQSFGTPEQSFTRPVTLVSLRRAYVNASHHGVTVLAASGDQGAAGVRAMTGGTPTYFQHAVVEWPASDPLVTGVGGTALALNTRGMPEKHVAWPVIDLPATRMTGTQLPLRTKQTGPGPEAVWKTSTPFEGLVSASGGGYSDVFTRPSYQDGVSSVVGDRRGVPDISMSASCSGAVNIYVTGLRGGAGWQEVCGTSEASPLLAGVVALADQEAHHPVGMIDPSLYEMAGARTAGIVAVTRGNNSALVVTPATGRPVAIAGYRAHAGYNLATGLGTVNAALFVPELVAAVARHHDTATYGISHTFLSTP